MNTIDLYELDEYRPWTEIDEDARQGLAALDEDRVVDFDDENDREAA